MAPPLPALQERYMADCRQDVDSTRISDDCLACVTANADRCATLELACGSVCQPPQDDPTFVDAGVPF